MVNLEPFLYVRESEIEGKGLFTSVAIPEGSVFFEITGEIIDEAECVRREDEENNVYIFWNGDHYIDTFGSEKIMYINHNCNFSCYVYEGEEDRLYLQAARNIMPDEELTIDYGYEEIYDMCRCDQCKEKGSE
ncbi:MAG: SET domain-containing protein [Ignavibacteria bacterium]|nr:SET domain-containing protein [Ignavibacteria bacterium]